MKINKVTMENFLSVANATVDFDKMSNLVHVKGINKDVKPESSNGAGKSTVIEAIAFALFGKTVRKTSARSLKNYHTNGKCKVTVTVNDNIVVTRQKSPPMLSLEIAGVSEIQDSIAATQKRLESLLNTNISIFLASMVFGQENSMNFLTATPDEKRDILQSFLNMSELFKHRVAIKNLKSDYNGDIKINKALMSETNSRIQEVSDDLNKIRTMRSEYNKLMTKEQKKFIRENSFSEISRMEKSKSQREGDLYKRQMDLHSLNSGITRKKSLIDDYEDMSCEKCGHLQEGFAEKISKLASQISSDSETIKDLEKEIKDINDEIDELTIPISDREIDVASNIKDSSTRISLLEKEKKSKKRLVLSYGESLKETTKNYEIMRFWEQAFSESGIIKYVIQNILIFFNDRCNFYLGVITKGTFGIEFNNTLDEILKNNGTECYYESLSGGEKKRISLAVTLALNDLLILSGKERSNIIFFDEVADSLDEVGMKGLHELIEEITKDKKLFLITHDEYLLSLIEDDAEVLDVIKSKNITTYTSR
jgi:DNA repair exonuclease SbcCD ATPase subunit